MTRRNVRKQGWVFPLFSPDSDDQLSLNFHRFVILYISCVTRSVGLGQQCLSKVYNGFKSCIEIAEGRLINVVLSGINIHVLGLDVAHHHSHGMTLEDHSCIP
jgi:hypothetical protein